MYEMSASEWSNILLTVLHSIHSSAALTHYVRRGKTFNVHISSHPTTVCGHHRRRWARRGKCGHE